MLLLNFIFFQRVQKIGRLGRSSKEKATVRVVIWNIYIRGRISMENMFSNACFCLISAKGKIGPCS